MTNTIATFEDRLFAVCHTAFHNIIRVTASCETLWNRRVETFNRHGLLSFVMPNPIKAPPIVIDHERLEDPVYRRRLAHKLTRPRPGKTVSRTINLDRKRLLTDENYCNDITKLLAYRFAGNLLPVVEIKDMLVLLKLDDVFVSHCLDTMGPHEIDGERVAAAWMRVNVEALVDKHPLFIESCNMIREVGAVERAKMSEFCAELAAVTMARFNAESAKIMDKINREADEYLDGVRARIRETGDSLRAPEPVLDPEAEFRKAVDARVRAHREANRLGTRAKLAIGAALAAVGVALAFFAEVNGTTLVEALF